jgi:hypothetical protein
MRLAEQAAGSKELMQRGQPIRGRNSGFGLIGRSHGERAFIIALKQLQNSNLKFQI